MAYGLSSKSDLNANPLLAVATSGKFYLVSESRFSYLQKFLFVSRIKYANVYTIPDSFKHGIYSVNGNYYY